MTTNNNNVIRTLPRMRTIPKAYAEIKALDSGTSFSMRALRRMVKSGEKKYPRIASFRSIGGRPDHCR